MKFGVFRTAFHIGIGLVNINAGWFPGIEFALLRATVAKYSEGLFTLLDIQIAKADFNISIYG